MACSLSQVASLAAALLSGEVTKEQLLARLPLPDSLVRELRQVVGGGWACTLGCVCGDSGCVLCVLVCVLCQWLLCVCGGGGLYPRLCVVIMAVLCVLEFVLHYGWQLWE